MSYSYLKCLAAFVLVAEIVLYISYHYRAHHVPTALPTPAV